MKVKVDEAGYSHREAALMEELVKLIRGIVFAESIPLDAKKSLVESLAFGITCLIDGSQVMELDGKPLMPVLTFANECGGDELLSCGGSSSMHELVMLLLHGDE